LRHEERYALWGFSRTSPQVTQYLRIEHSFKIFLIKKNLNVSKIKSDVDINMTFESQEGLGSLAYGI
jgi:hypothetical protein